MKIRHIVHLALAVLLSTAVLGCKNGLTIFEYIEQETELEDAVITGTVNSIVKLNGRLYASDGNIYSKDENAVRGWREIGGPGGIIIKLAADSSNLYALTKEKELYYSSDGSTWQAASCTPTSTKGIKTIFCDGNSTAYLQDDGGAIEKICNGTSTTSASDIPTTVVVVRSTDNKTYYADGRTVKGKNGEDLGSVSGLGTVYSLTYSTVDSALYAGTSKGLKKLPVDGSGKLTGAVQDPPGNWGATIKSYEAFAVLATGSGWGDSALYTSTISGGSDYSKINGLWGYYYGRRDTWNRE